MPESIIKTKVLFVNESDKVEEVVKQMIDSNISSCLVINTEELVTGIITERDIVHKFTLLDNKKKMKAHVNTVMSRPVKFIRLENLFGDIEKLHYSMGLRHFPVTNKEIPSKRDVIGMVTVTDIFRQHVAESNRILNESKPKSIFILAENAEDRKTYELLFKGVGFAPEVFAPSDSVINDILKTRKPLIFDLTTDDAVTMSEYIKTSKSHKGELFLVSEDARILPAYRKHLDSSHQHITIKPLDITYMKWLLDGAISGE